MTKNQKGFSLIELLVVVAIIGILAAVGVVAYNGFIGNAKVNASSTNHASIVKALGAMWTKCSLGATNVEYTDSAGAALDGSSVVACSGNAGTQQAAIIIHFGAAGFNNPYLPAQAAVTGNAVLVNGDTGVACAGTPVACTFTTQVDTGSTTVGVVTME